MTHGRERCTVMSRERCAADVWQTSPNNVFRDLTRRCFRNDSLAGGSGSAANIAYPPAAQLRPATNLARRRDQPRERQGLAECQRSKQQPRERQGLAE